MKSFQEIGIKLTDKISYHRYDRFYPQFLEPFRNEEFNMLEIGYGDGGGLELWKEYFPQAYINVIDIGVECEDDRSKVFKLDQSNDSNSWAYTLDFENSP